MQCFKNKHFNLIFQVIFFLLGIIDQMPYFSIINGEIGLKIQEKYPFIFVDKVSNRCNFSWEKYCNGYKFKIYKCFFLR